MRGQSWRKLRLHGKNRCRPEGCDSGLSMAWCEDREVWGGKSRRQLGLEEKAVDEALVLRWGRGRIWVLLSLVPLWQMLQQTG